MDIELAFNEYSMMLEPRLQEYMRRKRFNKQNNITPTINEEQEFSISKNDIDTINKYRHGQNYNKISGCDYVKASKKIDGGITNIDVKDDPRFKRIEEKKLAHLKAKQLNSNYEGIDKEYNIFHQTNPYDIKQKNKVQKISKPYYTENDFMLDSKDVMFNSNNKNLSYNPQNEDYIQGYHHEPKIAYNQILTPQINNGGLKHTRNIDDIIGNVDNYEKHLNTTYAYINNDSDNNNTKYNKEKEQHYKNVPFMYGHGIADVSLEDSMRGNVKDTKKKSVGFKNPFANYFSFISSDISAPEHTVNMRPVNTRGANKEIARPN